MNKKTRVSAAEMRIVKAVRALSRQLLADEKAEKLRSSKASFKASQTHQHQQPKFYDIDEMLVFDEIFRAVLENEHRRSTWKADLVRDAAYIDPMIDKWNDEQTTHYAEVRVRKDAGGYRLVYPGSASGTGPFATRRLAEDWFLGGGR